MHKSRPINPPGHICNKGIQLLRVLGARELLLLLWLAEALAIIRDLFMDFFISFKIDLKGHS